VTSTSCAVDVPGGAWGQSGVVLPQGGMHECRGQCGWSGRMSEREWGAHQHRQGICKGNLIIPRRIFHLDLAKGNPK
jgi:hypothetical protein